MFKSISCASKSRQKYTRAFSGILTVKACNNGFFLQKLLCWGKLLKWISLNVQMLFKLCYYCQKIWNHWVNLDAISITVIFHESCLFSIFHYFLRLLSWSGLEKLCGEGIVLQRRQFIYQTKPDQRPRKSQLSGRRKSGRKVNCLFLSSASSPPSSSSSSWPVQSVTEVMYWWMCQQMVASVSLSLWCQLINSLITIIIII